MEKMHTFHGSEVLTAATATEVTLNGSKQPYKAFVFTVVYETTKNLTLITSSS